MSPLSPEEQKRLAEIQERAEKATPGPWDGTMGEITQHWSLLETQDKCATVVGMFTNNRGYLSHDSLILSNEDADFIAHARSDIPALLAIIRRLSGRVEVLTEALRTETEAFDFHIETGKTKPGWTPERWRANRAALNPTEGSGGDHG